MDFMAGGGYLKRGDSRALMRAARDEMRARIRRRVRSGERHSTLPQALLVFSI
jgi:hypothetical protein